MAIIRWNPLNLSSLFEDDWDMPTFPGLSRLGQGLNLYETEDAIVAEAALPGIKDNNIDVTIDEGVVRISGSSTQSEEEKGNRRYFMSSMAQSFNYSFRLPQGVAESKEPEANFDNGVLTLRFEKVQKAAPKKIAIKATAKKEAK